VFSLPYSNRDINQLRQAIVHGDDEAKRNAIREVKTLGAGAESLIRLIAQQIRAGLYVPGVDLIDLLEAVPNQELCQAGLESGALTGLGAKCRLFSIGLADNEGELCAYLYRKWSDEMDPMVSVVITALERSGTSVARDTLESILPEIAESVNTTAVEATQTRSTNPIDKLSRAAQLEVLQRRVTQIRAALKGITSRTSGDSRD
jgi:hypothetical protein